MSLAAGVPRAVTVTCRAWRVCDLSGNGRCGTVEGCGGKRRDTGRKPPHPSGASDRPCRLRPARPRDAGAAARAWPELQRRSESGRRREAEPRSARRLRGRAGPALVRGAPDGSSPGVWSRRGAVPPLRRRAVGPPRQHTRCDRSDRAKVPRPLTPRHRSSQRRHPATRRRHPVQRHPLHDGRPDAPRSCGVRSSPRRRASS